MTSCKFIAEEEEEEDLGDAAVSDPTTRLFQRFSSREFDDEEEEADEEEDVAFNRPDQNDVRRVRVYFSLLRPGHCMGLLRGGQLEPQELDRGNMERCGVLKFEVVLSGR